jgi:adenylate kinase
VNEQKDQISQWLGTGSINIFGLPFAGKDTQGEKLAEMFNGVIISSGDILRHNKENLRLQDIMARGDIIPSDLFEEIVLPYLSNPEYKDRPLILSEVGRLHGEDEVVVRACKNSGHPQKVVILLKLPDDEVWRRFDESQEDHDRGNRRDDNKAVLQTRLDAYHDKVTPVLNNYREQGKLIEIDGTKSREEVTEEILNALLVNARL